MLSCIFLFSGPSNDLLQLHPSEKHFVRLANLIGIRQFDDFIIHLGLTRQEWEDIEDQYHVNGPVGKKVMALVKWKEKKESHFQEVRLRDTLPGIKSVANVHVLCQVM